MTNIIIRSSIAGDGDAILSIVDANVLWFRTIGSTQWGPELFSQDSTMSAYWKRLGGSGDLLGAGTPQTFIAEVDEWEEGKEGRRVGGFYVLGKKWPKYVPQVDEPALFINNAAIHPELRHKGVGAAMVDHAKSIASEMGTKIIRLDTYGGKSGTSEEGAKLVNAWLRLGFRRETQVAPNGKERNDTDPWQQILSLRV